MNKYIGVEWKKLPALLMLPSSVEQRAHLILFILCSPDFSDFSPPEKQ